MAGPRHSTTVDGVPSHGPPSRMTASSSAPGEARRHLVRRGGRRAAVPVGAGDRQRAQPRGTGPGPPGGRASGARPCGGRPAGPPRSAVKPSARGTTRVSGSGPVPAGQVARRPGPAARPRARPARVRPTSTGRATSVGRSFRENRRATAPGGMGRPPIRRRCRSAWPPPLRVRRASAAGAIDPASDGKGLQSRRHRTGHHHPEPGRPGRVGAAVGEPGPTGRVDRGIGLGGVDLDHRDPARAQPAGASGHDRPRCRPCPPTPFAVWRHQGPGGSHSRTDGIEAGEVGFGHVGRVGDQQVDPNRRGRAVAPRTTSPRARCTRAAAIGSRCGQSVEVLAGHREGVGREVGGPDLAGPGQIAPPSAANERAMAPDPVPRSTATGPEMPDGRRDRSAGRSPARPPAGEGAAPVRPGPPPPPARSRAGG